MPLFRKERSYTFSTALTKVFQRHDLRVGVDVVRHELNHIQAEFGDIGGVRGGFRFNGTVTGAPGYTPLLWNEFGTFLLGLQTYGGKDVQTEEMTGREWQSAIYLRDRWKVSSNLTISAGLRIENYPLMSRADRGIERLDLTTYKALIGGLGNMPDDVGINLKTLVPGAAARRDVPLRREGGGARRLRPHHQPAAVVAADARLVPAGHLLQPQLPISTWRSAPSSRASPTCRSRTPAPAGSPCRAASSCARPTRTRSIAASSSSGTSPTSTSCPATSRRKWPTSARARTAATPTSNLNYGVPGGGKAARQYFDVAGTTAMQRLGGADQEPLSRAAGGPEPSAAERLPAEGRLHLQPVEEHDPQRRGRLDRPHLEHAADVRPELRDRWLRSPARLPAGRSPTRCRS